MIEILIRYVGVKAIKALWRKGFPKLSMGELIAKRDKLKDKLEWFMERGKYIDTVNQRRRIAGVQMKIIRVGFKEDMKVIKRVCKRIKEQKKGLKKGE